MPDLRVTGKAAATAAALLLPCALQAQQGGGNAAERLELDERVEALVELDYYVSEDAANVVFDIAPGPLAGDMVVRAVLDGPGEDDEAVEQPLGEGGVTIVELPLDGLREGEFQVDLSISAGGRTVWEGEDTLVKRSAPQGDTRITQIDRYRRIMLVDGEPFFPMGVFGVFPDSLEEVAEGGFNVTLRWKGATTIDRYDREQPWDSEYNQKVVRDYLDRIQEAGLYAVETPVKLADESLYHRYRDVPGEYAEGPYWQDKYPVINEEVTPGVVRHARQHPAVIGYYNYDEPDNFWGDDPSHPKHLRMQEGVEEWYNTVKELDPYHAVMTLFAVGLSKVEDWEAWDVAMRDFYISRDEHMSKVYDVARDSAEVAWRMRTPFVYTPLFEESSGRPVPMSAEEQRAQTYLSLVADVKGVFYWDWPAAYAPNWEMLRQLAGEVNDLAPILLERAPEQEVAYVNEGTEKAVKVLVKNHEGRAYLIAVNAEPAPVRVAYKLPSAFDGDAQVRFEDGRTVELRRGVFVDTFEPYGRHVYELPGGPFERGEEVALAVTVGQAERVSDPEFRTTEGNLIVNGSFEYDYGRLPGWPVGWHPGDSMMEAGEVGTEEGRWTPVEEEAHHGERSLRLIKTAPGIGSTDDAHNLGTAPAIHQGVRYPEPGTYTFSAWMKADEPSRVWMMNGWSGFEPIDVGTEWKRYEIQIERGSAGGSFVRVHLMEQGTLWVDAVQVEKGATATAYRHVEPVR